MKFLCARIIVLLVCLTFCGVVGCKRTPPPPTPLGADQIGPEFQKAFSKAKPDVKQLADHVVSAVQSKDYAGAFQGVQLLCNAPDATEQQRLISARAMLTITALLQTAQSQGDNAASETLKTFQRNK